VNAGVGITRRPERAWLDASFDEFVSRSSRGLLRTAYLLTGDRGQADDLLQMTLVRTGQRWASAQTAPAAYAHRVLVNLSHDWRRGRARRVGEQPLPDHDQHGSPQRDHADAIATATRSSRP
jgi:DNA-directed RNA polymerase specialized sigma24 family protein